MGKNRRREVKSAIVTRRLPERARKRQLSCRGGPGTCGAPHQRACVATEFRSLQRASAPPLL
eukprot:6266797-Lingulodinium_polyedra.AAC.1